MYRTTAIYKMKNNFKKADAATAKTTATKQEKYEKKMAKYLANKARKEQLEKERREANRKKNENRKVGLDPSRLMYGLLTGIDKKYIGKTYTFGEMMSFNMGYNESNCPASARKGPKEYVYAGCGMYVSMEQAKSMGISIK